MQKVGPVSHDAAHLISPVLRSVCFLMLYLVCVKFIRIFFFNSLIFFFTPFLTLGPTVTPQRGRKQYFFFSCVMRKPVGSQSENQSSGFPTRFDTNRTVQPEKMVRDLKFCIYGVGGCIIYVAKAMALLQARICEKQVSHDASFFLFSESMSQLGIFIFKLSFGKDYRRYSCLDSLLASP